MTTTFFFAIGGTRWHVSNWANNDQTAPPCGQSEACLNVSYKPVPQGASPLTFLPSDVSYSLRNVQCLLITVCTEAKCQAFSETVL